MIEIIISFIIIIFFIILGVFISAYLENRTLTLFEQKTSSKQNSFLKPIADALKFLIQEDLSPKTRRKFLYFIAPLVVFCPVITAFCLIPINNGKAPLLSIAPSAILFLALISIPVIGAFFAGFSSNNDAARTSSIKSIIQYISFEIPMGISILAAAFLAGSLDINDIIMTQNGSAGLFSWNFIPQIIGCIIFFICSMMLLDCAPFCITKSENESAAGYTAEYSGGKLALFCLSEYALLFLISMFFVCLFFGGYLSPFGTYVLPDFLVFVEQTFWLILKTFCVIFFIFLIRTTLPRLSYERILDFSYKILLPLALINLNIAIIIGYFSK